MTIRAGTGFLWVRHSSSCRRLKAGTIYHYRVKSRANGQQLVSPDLNFKTQPPEPLTISDVKATPGKDQATITWTTNHPADCQVKYSTDMSYGSVEPSMPDATRLNHRGTLTGLTPGTTYNYKVESKDAAGQEAESTGNFQTSA